MRKIQFLGGVHEKQYKGERDCLNRGLWTVCIFRGAWEERGGGVFERGRYPGAHYGSVINSEFI